MFFDTTFLKNDEIQLVLEKTVDGDEEKGWVPAYHFAICNLEGTKMGTSEYAGGKLLGIAELPEDSDMRERGMTEKCIYRFEL